MNKYCFLLQVLRKHLEKITGNNVQNILVSTSDPVKLFLGACFPDFLQTLYLTKKEMAVITKRNLFDSQKTKVTCITGVWYKAPKLRCLSDALLHEAYVFFANSLQGVKGDPKGRFNFFLKNMDGIILKFLQEKKSKHLVDLVFPMQLWQLLVLVAIWV